MGLRGGGRLGDVNQEGRERVEDVRFRAKEVGGWGITGVR